jgi:predicted Zn-dependent protease
MIRMKKIKILMLAIAATVLAIHNISAQTKRDIILDAMSDELDRNMENIRLKNSEPPFYMMYGVEDQVTYNVSGSLGAITNSTKFPQRYKMNTRVLVGSYDFNDESLDENGMGNRESFDLPLPIDDDPLGICRSFWASTDNVYRSAARLFEKHKQTLKESNKKLDELPHRVFAKHAPVEMISTGETVTFDQKEWEAKVRHLSALFSEHKMIEHSTVFISFIQGHKYIVTSEGTRAKLPHSQATFTVMAQAKNDNGEFILRRIQHMSTVPSGIPDEKTCSDEIRALIASLEKELHQPTFEEEYSGPVLFLNGSAADVFAMGLFGSKETVVAGDNIPKQTGYQYNNQINALDGKLGKSLIHESITIKAKPRLKSYNGTALLGAFDMDNEGVVPPDEVIVFENGVLKELLNNRSLTHATQKSNGFNSGPGVLEITSTAKFTEKQLKTKLIENAKKRGLDYALVIHQGNAMGMMSVMRIAVADGKEEVLRNTMLNIEGLKALKGLVGVSADMQVIHQPFRGSQGGWGYNPALVSYIVPSAVLIEEVEVQPYMLPTLKEEQYVSKP